MPVTLNGGMQMPAWYDIFTLDPEAPDREDMRGVETAAANLRGMVEAETTQAGISRDRVIIGGFSQGGAVALYAMLKERERLGGCLALSTYLPGKRDAYDFESKSSTPVLQCHGESDEVVPFARGEQTLGALKELVTDVRFQGYPGMAHEAVPGELDLVKSFITEQLPEK